MRLQQGFTLIELLIVIAIVAILASVALPSYNDYVTRGKIVEATSGLAGKRVQIEQYFQDNRTYVGAPGCALDQTGQNFNFGCTGATSATVFVLEATGKGSMVDFLYTIDQAGARTSVITAPGWVGNAACWVRRKGGEC